MFRLILTLATISVSGSEISRKVNVAPNLAALTVMSFFKEEEPYKCAFY